MFVYVGTYTDAPMGHGEGVYVFRFDGATGALDLVQTVATVNPSFLALSPDQTHLFAVNELDEGMVSAFARNADTGELTAINMQRSHGAAPCYISVDPSGRNVLVANYTSGVVTVLPINSHGGLEPASTVIQHEGSSVNPDRQEGPHAHSIAPSADAKYILAADLGTDKIMVYQLDADNGKLTLNTNGPDFVTAEPGSGPRHFAFGTDGRYLYVVNELSSDITVFSYESATGQLTPIQTATTLPEDFAGKNTCAQIVVSPDGRFVYGSNRGHDSIAIFAIDQATGEIAPVGHQPTGGKDPRNFNIDPSGIWLLAGNQRGDSLVTYRRDQDTGLLTEAGRINGLSAPVAIVFAGE